MQKQTASQRVNEMIGELVQLGATTPLDSWHDFVESVSGKLPGAVMAALASGRSDLIKMCDVSGGLSGEEAQTLLLIVLSLHKTNAALRRHAEQCALMTKKLSGQLVGFLSVANQLEHFAHFRKLDERDADDE